MFENKISDDPTINLIAAAAGDAEYQQLVSTLRQAAQHFREKWNKLSAAQLEENKELLIIKNGKQIVIPMAAGKELLRQLHRGHRRISKTYLTSKELYFWPNMKSDITNDVTAYSACMEDLPAQPRQKLGEEKKPNDAMEELGVDYFNTLWLSWLVVVDCYSGYAWTDHRHTLS